MNVNLTDQEAQALIQLIDIAVQARGLVVAEAALVLAKKLQAKEEETLVPVDTETQ